MESMETPQTQRTGDEAESRNKHDTIVDLDDDKSDEDKDEDTTRRTSFVWLHFIELKGKERVQCKICRTKMQGHTKRNGTSSMRNHLFNVCKRSPVYKKKEGDSKNQSTLSLKKSTESGASCLETHFFSQEKCRMSLVRMCIKDNQPFSIVDDEGFKEYSSELQPRFKLPSRWTVARDCLKLYKEEALNLKNLLKDQIVSLTTDTWTFVQNVNYMCLTAHWVDDQWILRKRILNFCQIANHRGDTIGKLVYNCLEKWGIERVFTVTVDNASSNDGAIRYLAAMLKGPHSFLDCKYLHLRCCAHIINLVVRDGLEEQFESISKIRNAVKYVRSSPARYVAFKDYVEKVKIACGKKPSLDVDTRWNSTFFMLETAEKYATAFDRLYSIDSGYKAYCRSDVDDDGEESTRRKKTNNKVAGTPTDDDWENARYFIDYLRIFYNVTKKISGSKYVTSNMFFGELVTMHASISRMCSSTNEKKKRMAMSMKAKYDKYWDNIDNVNFFLYVAVVLDPRNKICYLEYCLDKIYDLNSPKTKTILERVNKTIEELFQHFKGKMEVDRIQKTSGTSSSTFAHTYFESGTGVSLEDDFAKFLEQRGRGVNKTEVEIYLSDAMEKRVENFEVLAWWKLSSLKFPILSQVARHVLGMPITTVASESAFSTGGRVIDQYRSNLTPVTAEALICTQDWLRSAPADIEHPVLSPTALQEMQEMLEKLEIDELGGGQSMNDSCMDLDDI